MIVNELKIKILVFGILTKVNINFNGKPIHWTSWNLQISG